MTHQTKLFESFEDDTPLWVGMFNDTTIEIYERDDTGAEEVYASPGQDQSLLDAACNLSAFLDSSQPENYNATYPDNSGMEPDEIIVNIGDEPWTSFTIEGGEEGSVVVGDIQIEDEDLDYLQINGVLPDPSRFTDIGDPDMSNPEDDFWLNSKR